MTVKIVNGAKIRNSIDTDFSGAGSHADYPYIPLGELWIDRYLKEERALFVNLWKLERSMRGKPFRTIRDKAKRTFARLKNAQAKIVKSARKGELIIRYVDGASVRKGFDPYFLLGGHDLVHPYIPKREIWIDVRQDPGEWTYTLTQQLDERARIHKGLSYENAHDFALATQRLRRRKDGVADFPRG